MQSLHQANIKLNTLEQKMQDFFLNKGKKPTEPRLITTEQTYHEEYEQLLNDKKTSKDSGMFKIFTKGGKTGPMKIEQIMEQKQTVPSNNFREGRAFTDTFKPSSQGRKQSQVEGLIEEVEMMQRLIKKKLALKQQKMEQLQKEIQMEVEEEKHLFRINQQLEKELLALNKRVEVEERDEFGAFAQLEMEEKHLKKQQEKAKKENKTLKHEEELLKQSLKNMQKSRKQYIQRELRRHHSKSGIEAPPNHKHEREEADLRKLVKELDKLKQIVKEKMKKSVSRSKIHA